MKTVQFREAICEAMSEEMRLDESIYLIGEEVAEYNGAYKASKPAPALNIALLARAKGTDLQRCNDA